MSAKQQVVEKKEGGALAQYDYGADAGVGFGSLGKESLAIPFLMVLQGLSPELETVEGAKPGMLYNSVTGELFDGRAGVAVVPCEGNRSFVEWRPREAGGGIVNRYTPEDPFVKKATAGSPFGKIKLENGNDLMDTYYMYVMLVKPDGNYEPAAIGFKSTGIKVFRNWRTKISLLLVGLPDGRRVRPPVFAHRFRLTTHKEKNQKGEWWTIDPTFDGRDASEARLDPKSDLYAAARDFAKSVSSGAVTMAAEAREPGSDDDKGPGATDHF